MDIETSDCVVLGGGPAGSTFATIARKYAPDAKVVVLEKARFPRWHIGESTIPAANGVLEDLGVYRELLASDFVKKLGVTFVWGRDRVPWNADYLTLRHEGDIIEVTGQDLGALLGPGHEHQTPFSAFNVERSRFDDLLLRQSRRHGADVREGTRATSVQRVGTSRSHIVTWEDDAGRKGRLLTDFVLDATGLSHLMTKGQREHAPDLNNFAVFGYLRGAEWKVNFNGTREASTVFIAAVEKGWIWYFPLGPDLMTVGAVTNTAHFKDRLRDVDLEAFFWEMLRACPEVASLVEHATLRDDVLPDGARVSACRDWSSWARNPVGEGWAAAGDAAMFVDPILSTGVTLALQTGHRAAYTWLTTRARPDLSGTALWRAYADYLRGEYGSFLLLARYFYGNNKAAPSWWWEAQRLVNASGRLQLSDRQAFTMATAGFFPMPRALGAQAEVVAPLLRGITGGGQGLEEMYRNAGVPEPDELEGHGYEVVTRFRLDLRTEPGLERGSTGRLEVYHDLVTEELLTHRLAAVPTRIDPGLAPVVDVMPRHRRAADLVTAAQAMLREQDPARVRSAVLGLLRVAAMKGFVRLRPRHEADVTALEARP